MSKVKKTDPFKFAMCLTVMFLYKKTKWAQYMIYCAHSLFA